jgi:hypothetical protein
VTGALRSGPLLVIRQRQGYEPSKTRQEQKASQGLGPACPEQKWLQAIRKSGGSACPKFYRGANTKEYWMYKLHSIAALCGDGLRPELQALFDRLAVDPHSGLHVRHDGMTQSGPDPVSEAIDVAEIRRARVA